MSALIEDSEGTRFDDGGLGWDPADGALTVALDPAATWVALRLRAGAPATGPSGGRIAEATTAAVTLLDSMPPQVSFTDLGGWRTRDAASVSFTADDNVGATFGLGDYTLTANAATDGTATGASTTLAAGPTTVGSNTAAVDLSALADGVHRVDLTVRNAGAGSLARTVAGTLRIDRVPPAVPSLTGGSPDWSNASSVTITGASSDVTAGVASFRHRTRLGGGPWSAEVDGASANVGDEGLTEVQVRAVDNAGLESDWSPVAPEGTVRLDRTAPTASDAAVTPNSDGTATVRFALADGAGSGIAATPDATLRANAAADGSPAGGWSTLDAAPGMAGQHAVPVALDALAEGTHALRVDVSDVAGNAAALPLAPLTVDRTAPTLTGLTATQTGTVTGSLSWSQGDAGIGIDPTAAAVAINAATGAADPSAWSTLDLGPRGEGAQAISVPLEDLADGEHAVRVRARDRYGNAALVDATLRVDATPPVAPTLTAGPDGATREAPALFRASTEPGASLAWSATGPGGFTATGTGPALSVLGADGTYTVEVRATDAVGWVGPPAVRTFVRDTTEPTVSAFSGRQTAPQALELTYEAADQGVGVDEAVETVVEIEAGGWIPIAVTRHGDGPQTVYAAIPATLADGAYPLRVRLRDRIGNAAVAAGSPVAIDRSAPALTDLSAVRLGDGRVAVRAAVADPGSGIAPDATVAIDVEAAQGWRTLVRAPVQAGGNAFVVDGTALDAGPLRLRLAVADAVGNEGAAEVAVAAAAGLSAPVVANVSQTWADPRRVILEWDVVDAGQGVAASGAEIEVDGEWRPVAGGEGGAGHHRMEVDLGALGLPDGRYRLRLTGDDPAGRRGTAVAGLALVSAPPAIRAEVVKSGRRGAVVRALGHGTGGLALDPAGWAVEIARADRDWHAAGPFRSPAPAAEVTASGPEGLAARLGGLADGRFLVRVRARDVRGNAGASEGRPVEIGSAAPPVGSILVRDPGPTRFLVRYPRPRPVTLAGRFIAPGHRPLGHRRLALVERGLTRREVVTDARGRFRIRYRPVASGALLVRWAGSDRRRAISLGWRVEVVPHMAAHAPGRASAGRPWTLSGAFRPEGRQPVLLYQVSTRKCPRYGARGLRGLVTARGTLTARGRRAMRAVPARCWAGPLPHEGPGTLAADGRFRLRARFNPPPGRGAFYVALMQPRVPSGAFGVVRGPVLPVRVRA